MGIIYLTTNKINNRKYIGVDSKNNKYYFGSGKSIKLALKKYGTESFNKEIIEENDSIEYLFEREKYWINYYDAINSKDFYNMAEGGKGGSGTLIREESKKLHLLGCIEGGKIVVRQRKGKTYEEIYGDRAEEEKEKRRLAGFGKKYSEERIKKVSEALKGKMPWNKGLTREDPRVKKCIDNHIHKKFLKTYILKTPENLEIIFNGKIELELYLKKINSTFKLKSRVNVDNLIKNKFDKDFNLILQ